MDKFKSGDVVRWYYNPSDYITGAVVEVCGDGTFCVEYHGGEKRHYNGSALVLHNPETDI